ncbi:MAG TPA: SDR family oxidoreductase [Acidimicrobiales bacterium]|nr:SDR family oxidoreductase [Acidimicrobiales bacterium]
MSELPEGSVALITGGGGGIGRAIAARFAAAGARVLLMGRTAATLEDARQAIGADDGVVAAFAGDVASGADCQAAVDECVARWGRLDVLVNSAAIDDEADFMDMTEAAWDAVIDVNLKGPYLLSQAAARVMLGQGGGSMVHISSIDNAGADGPYTSYNVSKTGLVSLSRCIAVELAPFRIRSNVVSPGATKTEMIERVMGSAMMDYMEHRFERVPMHRMVLPEEVAEACLFLASDRASAITGVDLAVDCGTLANLYVMETMPAPEAVASS